MNNYINLSTVKFIRMRMSSQIPKPRSEPLATAWGDAE